MSGTLPLSIIVAYLLLSSIIFPPLEFLELIQVPGEMGVSLWLTQYSILHLSVLWYSRPVTNAITEPILVFTLLVEISPMTEGLSH